MIGHVLCTLRPADLTAPAPKLPHHAADLRLRHCWPWIEHYFFCHLPDQVVRKLVFVQFRWSALRWNWNFAASFLYFLHASSVAWMRERVKLRKFIVAHYRNFFND